jgi:ADP-ribosylation factor protein 1
MGAKWSKFNHSRWFSKKHRKVIVIGIQGAGKSSVVHTITANLPKLRSSIPALGIYKVKSHGLILNLYDLKGDTQNQFFWRHHFQGTQGVLFIVDMSSSSKIQESSQVLHQIMLDGQLKRVPFLILCNKVEESGKVPINDLPEMLNLTHENTPPWQVFKSVASCGVGVMEALEWLVKEMTPV